MQIPFSDADWDGEPSDEDVDCRTCILVLKFFKMNSSDRPVVTSPIISSKSIVPVVLRVDNLQPITKIF